MKQSLGQIQHQQHLERIEQFDALFTHLKGNIFFVNTATYEIQNLLELPVSVARARLSKPEYLEIILGDLQTMLSIKCVRLLLNSLEMVVHSDNKIQTAQNITVIQNGVPEFPGSKGDEKKLYDMFPGGNSRIGSAITASIQKGNQLILDTIMPKERQLPLKLSYALASEKTQMTPNMRGNGYIAEFLTAINRISVIYVYTETQPNSTATSIFFVVYPL